MTKINNYVIAILLCLQTMCHYTILTVGQYIYACYLQTYPSSSNTTQNLTEFSIHPNGAFKTFVADSGECLNSTMNSSISDAELWAQEQSADLFFRIDLWNSCPMIIMTYVLGRYTPKLGRRFVLILPMLGTAVQLSIWLAIIYFHLADYWWCVASFLVGLSGSDYIFRFVLNLIITDSTNEDNRSSRFVLFESITTTAAAIFSVSSGYYINWRGFTDLYWISLGLQIISIIIVLLFIRNPSKEINERTSLLSMPKSNEQTEESRSVRTKCTDCFTMFKILGFKNRSTRKAISLFLILFAYIFYLLAYSTYSSFLWYLLDAPFCWSSENVGLYTALSLITCAIFSLIGMHILTYFGANDIVICIFSYFCWTLSSLLIAFSKHSWQLYAALFISAYAEYPNSLTIPMMSRYLDVSERNHVFTLVAEVTTIITTFGDSIFNWVYAKTVYNFRNFTILVSVGFSIMGFILTVLLFVVTRKIRYEELVEITESEPLLLPNNTIAQSNDIISSLLITSTVMTKSFTEDESQSNMEPSVDINIL